MIGQTPCVVCRTLTTLRQGRCTNGCCANCHAQFCTPGGITSPGHGLDIKAAKVKLAAFRKGEQQ